MLAISVGKFRRCFSGGGEIDLGNKFVGSLEGQRSSVGRELDLYRGGPGTKFSFPPLAGFIFGSLIISLIFS